MLKISLLAALLAGSVGLTGAAFAQGVGDTDNENEGAVVTAPPQSVETVETSGPGTKVFVSRSVDADGTTVITRRVVTSTYAPSRPLVGQGGITGGVGGAIGGRDVIGTTPADNALLKPAASENPG